MTLLTLPHELLERILLLLSTESVQTCKLVNRTLNGIIQSSTLLQYFQACEAAGVIDNPRSPLPYAERLEALKKREDVWRELKPVFEMTIIKKVNPQTAHIYRSTEGVYFFPNDNLKEMNCCHLTPFPQDNSQRIKIPGVGPALDWSGILVGFSTALYEHDLIVHLISSVIEIQEDMQWYSLDLVLLKFSTGEYHPIARHPRIHVQKSAEDEPWVEARIVGDNLALVIYSADPTFPDRLLIFDWKTGRKLLEHDTSENNTYFDLVFVSPELLLVPNRVLSHIEIWHIPPQQHNPKPPIQILSLQIPTFSPGFSHHSFRCYGEPSPFLHSMPFLPPRPFFSSPEYSIIIITLRIVSISGRRASYNLIVHRRALLDTIQTWTSPSLLEQQECLPTWLTNDVTVHEIADQEDGSVHLDAQSKSVSAMPHSRSSPPTRDYPTTQTSRTFPTSDISADSGSSSVASTKSSISRCTFLRVPWAKRNAETMARLRSGGDEDDGSNGNDEEGKEEEAFEILDHKGLFSEEVSMGLKCVVYRAPDEHDFDAVLMDEERLLGEKVDGEGWPESIRALYIG